MDRLTHADTGVKGAKLKREHFIRIDIDEYHYYYSFSVPGFEICLEPCAAGFDVAVYGEYMDIGPDAEPRPNNHLTAKSGIRKIPTDFKSAIGPKQCTKTGDYTQIDALFGDRRDEDWNRALEIAYGLLEKYMIREREDVKMKLAGQTKEKVCACYTEGKSLCGNKHSMNTIIHANVTCPDCLAILRRKCMFCGCTDDNACPGGCSWVAPNVCSRCADKIKGNELISREEILSLRARAKTITMQDGLRMTLQGGFVPVIPMDLKSGYGVSLTIIENLPDRNPIEVFSVGSHKGMPDPADSESIAMAVLGEGYGPLPSLLPSGIMVHFWKRRK